MSLEQIFKNFLGSNDNNDIKSGSTEFNELIEATYKQVSE
jgi:hypothetical protein